MAQSKNDAVLALLESLGISASDVAAAIGASNTRAARKSIKVDVMTGDDARQYGDVSVSKAVNGGRFIAKLGVFEADLDGFIADLQAARDVLSGS